MIQKIVQTYHNVSSLWHTNWMGMGIWIATVHQNVEINEIIMNERCLKVKILYVGSIHLTDYIEKFSFQFYATH